MRWTPPSDIFRSCLHRVHRVQQRWTAKHNIMYNVHILYLHMCVRTMMAINKNDETPTRILVLSYNILCCYLPALNQTHNIIEDNIMSHRFRVNYDVWGHAVYRGGILPTEIVAHWRPPAVASVGWVQSRVFCCLNGLLSESIAR